VAAPSTADGGGATGAAGSGMRNLPPPLAALTALPHWVIWRWKTNKGKQTKVPYQPGRSEFKAKSNDPGTHMRPR